jgi:hypothetical protein
VIYDDPGPVCSGRQHQRLPRRLARTGAAAAVHDWNDQEIFLVFKELLEALFSRCITATH